MQDRLRLRINPKNVSVPAGYVDLYYDSKGNLVEEASGGASKQVGGDKELTNAQVNAAIAADPAASRAAIGAVGKTGDETIGGNKTFTGQINMSTLTVQGNSNVSGALTVLGKTTLKAAKIDLGSDATGDIHYRNSAGDLARLGVGTNGFVLTLAAGLPTWAAAAVGGGLTQFTESLSTAAPNASIPCATLTPSNAATNVDFILKPKGQGAICAVVPDNTLAGGNKRGSSAVDLQVGRSTAASRVASGAWSVLLGGSDNSATGMQSVCCGGAANQATSGNVFLGGGVSNSASGNISTLCGGQSNGAAGAHGFIGGGQTNTTAAGTHAVINGGSGNTIQGASTHYATIGGGQNNFVTAGNSGVVGGGIGNQVSGIAGTVGGGQNNEASGQFSTVAGGFGATTRGTIGAEARSSSSFASRGDAQHGGYILMVQSSNATPIELTADRGVGSVLNRLVLPNNSAYGFTGKAIARHTLSGEMAMWEIKGAIRRGATAATTVLVGAPTVTKLFNDTGASGAATWALAVTADATFGGVKVMGTGHASEAVRWLCELETLELVI